MLSRMLTAGGELAINGFAGEKKSMLDKVDVLIVGSGASGAAVAWSLADTRMRIVCLEQGDWSLLDPVRARPAMYRTVD